MAAHGEYKKGTITPVHYKQLYTACECSWPIDLHRDYLPINGVEHSLERRVCGALSVRADHLQEQHISIKALL